MGTEPQPMRSDSPAEMAKRELVEALGELHRQETDLDVLAVHINAALMWLRGW